MAKVTPWFPIGVKPVHVGVYQTLDEETFQHWDGKQWGYCASRPSSAMTAAHFGPSCVQEPKWRGLTSKPKEPK